MAQEKAKLIALTVEIVGNYVLKNTMPVSGVPALISVTYAALAGIRGGAAEEDPGRLESLTAAQIRKSITYDALISFEDGRPYKTLKRHLTTRGMTPAQYKDKWGLPIDYPMTARAYSEARSSLAKALGLGQAAAKSKAAKKRAIGRRPTV